jgi:DNA-3-methyladenine glycosylase II
MHRIATLADVAAGLDALAGLDPRLVAVRRVAGKVPLQPDRTGLRQPRLDHRVAAGVDGSSADAIFGRIAQLWSIP